jgi:predicted CXXCH cytochrome family protein
MLLVAAGSLWLFLAALPVFADGGPHVKAENNGVSSLTADGCAGCHRARTANGPMLLIADNEEELCLDCHGAAGTGATTDVVTGVQYAIALDGLRDDTAELGALRGGGFEEARIGDPYRYMVGTSRLSKVQVLTNVAGTATASEPVTSAHMDLHGTLGNQGVAWGSGANGSGAGATLTLGCASCHNPHGNGQYRILNPVPVSTTTIPAWVAQVVDYGVSGAGQYRTAASHSFLVGDTVIVAGNTLGAAVNVTATVATVPASNTFTLTGVADAGTGTGGTATLSGGAKVTDAALPPVGDARNYTVIQTPTTAGYTLLASQAGAFDAVQGDYFHYRVPWNGTAGTNNDAPNGMPGTVVGTRSFGQEITAWCSACHTRYMAYQQPLTDPADGTVGAAYDTARPGDTLFEYQHRTRGASGRGCLTCHVSHGSNAAMTGTFSATTPLPNGVVSDSSRLLKVENRGTCQLCHDPTGTSTVADNPVGPIPSVP